MSLFLGNLDKTKSGTMRDQININKKFILGITLVSAMDGLLFGYGWEAPNRFTNGFLQ